MLVLVAQLCLTLCDPGNCNPPVFCPWNSPGKNTGMGNHPLLQWVFPTQGSNPDLPHCRQILYHLSHRWGMLIMGKARHAWWRRQWHPTPVLLPGKSHGWRSLVGSSPWGRWVAHDWATSLSCIGEGNGNPLQCSCLENPRDGGTWWATVSGVAQSWTRLKRLSSSSRHAWRWWYMGNLYNLF